MPACPECGSKLLPERESTVDEEGLISTSGDCSCGWTGGGVSDDRWEYLLQKFTEIQDDWEKRNKK